MRRLGQIQIPCYARMISTRNTPPGKFRPASWWGWCGSLDFKDFLEYLAEWPGEGLKSNIPKLQDLMRTNRTGRKAGPIQDRI